MGYSKPKIVSAEELSLAQLPAHGKTYTVIRHKFIIDAVKSLLTTHNFNVTDTQYRANHGCKVAQGIYRIESQHDPELGMMFAWTNSYDKSTRFQCGIGAYVFVCDNGMISGDMASYARKHTGNADQQAFNHITSHIKQGNKHFINLVKDKDDMKKIFLSKKEQAELAGRLFFEKELIDASQMSCVKKEMNKPTFEYECDLNNAWAFYNHVTHSLKMSHPKSWMSDQQKFHEFMTAEVLSHTNLHNFDQTNAEDYVDPNQTSILDHEIELADGTIIDELDAAEPWTSSVDDFDADIEAQDEKFGEFKI
jgi:hypothetical protein